MGAWSLELDPLHEAVGRCVPIGSLDDAPLEAAVAEPIGDDGTFTLAACGAAACSWAPVSAGYGSPGRGCRIASICSTATTIRHLESILFPRLV